MGGHDVGGAETAPEVGMISLVEVTLIVAGNTATELSLIPTPYLISGCSPRLASALWIPI